MKQASEQAAVEALYTSNMSATYSTVEQFVAASGGDHAIKKILIANNGIGAIKAIRSVRRWSFEVFGNERMVRIYRQTHPPTFPPTHPPTDRTIN